MQGFSTTRCRVLAGDLDGNDGFRESPVRNGVYLVMWWRVPDPKDALPRVAAFRIDGRGCRRWVDETLSHPAAVRIRLSDSAPSALVVSWTYVSGVV